MAAVDYNQPTPQETSHTSSTHSQDEQNSREVSNDTVSLTQSSPLSTEVGGASETKSNTATNTQMPVDSLSALLNRQVQHQPKINEAVNNTNNTLPISTEHINLGGRTSNT